jgi:hypothetical protein
MLFQLQKRYVAVPFRLQKSATAAATVTAAAAAASFLLLLKGEAPPPESAPSSRNKGSMSMVVTKGVYLW